MKTGETSSQTTRGKRGRFALRPNLSDAEDDAAGDEVEDTSAGQRRQAEGDEGRGHERHGHNVLRSEDLGQSTAGQLCHQVAPVIRARHQRLHPFVPRELTVLHKPRQFFNAAKMVGIPPSELRVIISYSKKSID